MFYYFTPLFFFKKKSTQIITTTPPPPLTPHGLSHGLPPPQKIKGGSKKSGDPNIVMHIFF